MVTRGYACEKAFEFLRFYFLLVREMRAFGLTNQRS